MPSADAPAAFVIATAGHVDHGKSALVRALTGMEPDRWAEERRRGLTIDLGFAWTILPSGRTVSFVDVPGHERFVPNMLAGVGPVPAVMLVVAADSGWMPQTGEHVAALDALGVNRGVVVITRCDLADPEPVRVEVADRLTGTSLEALPAIPVSAVSSAGMTELVAALDAVGAGMPAAVAGAPVRLWVDRSFSIRGAGTVVTGTLSAGTVRVGDELSLNAGPVRMTVRSLQSMDRAVDVAVPVTRLALNLRGVERDEIGRGDALAGPGPWTVTALVDGITTRPVESMPATAVLHVGSAAVAVRTRALGATGVRLALARPVPLMPGDRLLLRDPGRHAIITGVDVVDPSPLRLQGRGAALQRERELADPAVRWSAELGRRGFLRAGDAVRLGLSVSPGRVVSGWHVDPERWAQLPELARAEVSAWEAQRPLEPGMPVAVLLRRLRLPDPPVLDAVIAGTGLSVEQGVVTSRPREHLPAKVDEAVRVLEESWDRDPLRAPEVPLLRDLGLGPAQLTAAARAGRVLVLEPGVVIHPRGPEAAEGILSRLDGPFTVSQARQALGTTRKVAVPLLELLDRTGRTLRVSPELREVVRRDA